MVKYFCDICKKEVSSPAMSLDMTGKVLCHEHFYQAREAMHKTIYTYTKDVTESPCDNCDIDYPSCNNCIGA